MHSEVQIMTDNSHKYCKMLHNFLLSSMQWIHLLPSPLLSVVILFFSCRLLSMPNVYCTYILCFVDIILSCFANGICLSIEKVYQSAVALFPSWNHLSYLNDCNSICQSVTFFVVAVTFTTNFSFRIKTIPFE